MTKKYTEDYVKMILDQSSSIVKEEGQALIGGSQKEWSMSNGVVLEALNMAHKVFNKADTHEERVNAFILIEAIVEEYTINVLPDEHATTIH